ncbi:MAG: hypothetical protein H5T86_13590, partial [Armatimonadetes bacterium]|nr:hypothetical protein [Armatimonadota bacterium]
GTLAGRIGAGVLQKPQGIAVTPDGCVVVADGALSRVFVFSAEGRLLRAIGSPGRRPGQFRSPRAVDVAPDGRLAVADTKNHRIQVFGPKGELLLAVGRFGSRPGEFNIPEGLRFGPDGLLYVADTVNHRVQVLDRSGKVVRIIGQYGIDPGCLYFPEDVAIDTKGRVYVSDTFNQRISIFHAGGSLLALSYTFSGGQALTYPYGIALGEDESLWVLDMPSGQVGVVEWAPAPPEVLAAARQAVRRPTRAGDRLMNLLAAGQISPRLTLLALLIAVLLGAAHALEPGHGKTLVAAYLVGTRGKPWHAIVLGLTVTVTHVGSVVIVGLIALAASEYVLPSAIAPWLSLASGLVIAAVGIWMFRRAGAGHSHAHEHGPGRSLTEDSAERGHSHPHGPAGHTHIGRHEGEWHGEWHEDLHGHVHTGGDGGHPHEHHHGHWHSHCAESVTRLGAGDDEGAGQLHLVEGQAPAHDAAVTKHGDPAPENLGSCDPCEHSGDVGHRHYGDEDGDHWHHGARGHQEEARPAPIPRRDRGLGLVSLLSLGISGGIVPCPSAIAVLLTAVSIGRVGLGIALILAFSIGLALTLVALGVAATLGAGLIGARLERSKAVTALPYVSAGVVTGLGILVALQGLRALGVI